MRIVKPAKTAFILIALAAIGASYSQDTNVRLGTAINEADLANFDLIAGPDGSGFPEGSGRVSDGKLVFDSKCAACHASNGEGTTGNTRLVGGNMDSEGSPLKTVGSFWPHASTVFDFIQRAMPANAPKSLTTEEVYQVTAYVLFLNGILDENSELDKNSLMAIEMPNKDGFTDQSRIQ